MIQPLLHPGDSLLYGPTDIFGYVTCVKTWSDVCHIEGYAGGGMSVASRNGVGVNMYPFRKENLKHILRPVGDFDFGKAMEWFKNKAQGQKYDWKGLLCFTLAVKQGSPKKMFCSEFMTRWYRAGQFNAISSWFDADKVAPGSFLVSPVFDKIY